MEITESHFRPYSDGCDEFKLIMFVYCLCKHPDRVWNNTDYLDDGVLKERAYKAFMDDVQFRTLYENLKHNFQALKENE